MSVNSNDFLEFAKRISTETEIGVRNAVSRAYYSMYSHAANQYGLSCKKDSSIKKKGSHERMADYINLSLPRVHHYPQDLCNNLSLQLTKVKHRRHAADYHLNVKMEEGEAYVALNTATAFIFAMNSLTQ
ncbi:hypothetical protein [Serratia sp. M24T3]|uniref:hypothetical protein n=1 Tax=Serratia sp. M24T3 TaxID=932213 RepID=UPI00025B8F28|nr:hypothetical protein [Serratia sp. M24T3]EIC83966.1 hypothetical protein SPM24T3_13655 [Serratia sp. M24T3]